jgi:prolyl-tRNA editing enzyme YbaK/EbsC (Cys-tRNA(Pro) deacylase)
MQTRAWRPGKQVGGRRGCGGALGRGPAPVAPCSVQTHLPVTHEDAVRSTLARLRVEAEEIPCDPEFADTAAFCERYGFPLDRSANTIVVASRRDPAVACACVLLATARLDVNHRVRELLGERRLSFADAELTTSRTGMAIGGVTPFGLPDDLPVFVDSSVLQRDWVIVGGGSRSLKLRVAPDALLKLPAARAVEGLAHEVNDADR